MGCNRPANSHSVVRCIQLERIDTRMTKRRNFSDQFKAAVALEALRGDKTVQEIAAKRQLHPTQVSTLKRQAIEGMADLFSDKVKKAENKDGEIKELHAKIGQLTMENGTWAYAALLGIRSR